MMGHQPALLVLLPSLAQLIQTILAVCYLAAAEKLDYDSF
jgi:hypothetical protein